MRQKTLILIVVLALIAAAVLYLNSLRADEGSLPAEPLLEPPPATSETLGAREPADSPSIETPSPYPLAEELRGLVGSINTDGNISLASLRGQVVLIDFWTYSCINCIRTLPYLTAWDATYREQGLVIIGVHTPEFEFEKDIGNVRAAVEKHGIEYPVVLDSNKATWRAYRNSYWPRKYLIDAQGRIRYDHIGEGAYEETESKIRELLMERDDSLQLGGFANVVGTHTVGTIATPEIYFGYLFARGNFGNAGGLQRGVSDYVVPADITFNYAYLDGTWNVTEDYSELVSDSGLVVLPYRAKALNIVAGAQENASAVITLDNAPVPLNLSGSDAPEGIVEIAGERLYNLISAPESGTHLIIINATKGFRIYTFTFG